MPVTDVAGGCFRSSANYPALAAKALGMVLDDRACGGAQTEDVTRAQHPGVPPQQTALTARTELVTVGLGGNDGGVFRTLVGGCFGQRPSRSGGTCSVTLDASGRSRLLASLGRTERRLVAVLRLVHQRAPRARVLAVGYPQLVSSAHVCALLPFTRADYAFGERVNHGLSEAVRRAAQAAGATYVDVWRASRGHDICSKDPWVNGPRTDQRRAAAYHPFAVEQAAVARLVEAAAR